MFTAHTLDELVKKAEGFVVLDTSAISWVESIPRVEEHAAKQSPWFQAGIRRIQYFEQNTYPQVVLPQAVREELLKSVAGLEQRAIGLYSRASQYIGEDRPTSYAIHIDLAGQVGELMRIKQRLVSSYEQVSLEELTPEKPTNDSAIVATAMTLADYNRTTLITADRWMALKATSKRRGRDLQVIRLRKTIDGAPCPVQPYIAA